MQGELTPIKIRAYLRLMPNLLTELAQFKDERRVALLEEYTAQLEEMRATVLKRGDAITNNST